MAADEIIIFRGVVLKHFDGRQSQDGSSFFTRMYLSAEFSDVVREKMDWDDPGNCIKPGAPAKLTGELLAHTFILSPGDKRLKDYEMQLGIKDVTDFQVITLKDDEGEPAGRQLRFTIRTPQDGASGLCEQYIRAVGRHEGQLKVTYVPVAVQQDLPGAKAEPTKPDDGQEPIGEFLQGDALAAHEAHQEPAAESQPGPVLAPARVMGGTHQRGTRGRRNQEPRNPEREAVADGSAPIDVLEETVQQ